MGTSSALRRLSRVEIERTLADVFGITGLATQLLPPDIAEPYDTEIAAKKPSAVFAEGLENLAADVAERASADAALIIRAAGCQPATAADADCLRSFVANVGKQLLRRPPTDDELEQITAKGTAIAQEQDDFAVGVRLTLQMLMLMPEFVYQVEIGVPEGDRKRLNNYELVARLSYLFWGGPPNKSLLSRAAGATFAVEDVNKVAETMAADPRTTEQIRRFHRLWLGYHQLHAPEELRTRMLRETEALIERVVIDGAGQHSELFSWPETRVDRALAENYGLSTSGSSNGAGWITYANSQRAGVLAHGSMLSLGAASSEATSPTTRGKYIATRFLCLSVPEPPPDVDADQPPQAGADQCKVDAYAAHRDQGSACYNCHQLMDPIGFGLERFDGLGRYRLVEEGKPQCDIVAQGSVPNAGDFSGMRELGQLMRAENRVQRCVAQQFFHFAMGRAPTPADQGIISRALRSFTGSGESFRRLMLAIANDPTFRYRAEPAPSSASSSSGS